MVQTIKDTISQLHASLRDYIEATYHVGALQLSSSRGKGFSTGPASFTRFPILNPTPRYQSGQRFSAIEGLHPAALEAFSILAEASTRSPGRSLRSAIQAPVGIYQEQSRRRQESPAIMTGTGSGKTESFLLPILGKLCS